MLHLCVQRTTSNVSRLIIPFASALLLIAVSVYGGVSRAADGGITVVAAENFYGDIARQLAGDGVAVISVISNPAEDPHLFEVTPGIVRQAADAQIVVLNGAGYDSWMEKILASNPRPLRIVINAAELTGYKTGDNPHIWYAPATMPKIANAIAVALAKVDPGHAADYRARLTTTLASLAAIEKRAADLKAKFAGTSVTATEPVFGAMADALGLVMRNQRFQLAVMNETEPGAREIAAFENDLRDRRVKVLFYNSQVSAKLTDRLRTIAVDAKIPVVGITETMPAGSSYQNWLLNELDMLDKALSGPPG